MLLFSKPKSPNSAKRRGVGEGEPSVRNDSSGDCTPSDSTR
ncbi:MAG TPA: hypothetical protein VHP31_12340 [Caproicibacter sp.]|nr:hypothetical protein [Caproicibacter sp.]